MWLSRLRNVVGNDELSTAGVVWRVAVVLLFVALASGVVAALRTGRPPLRRSVHALAVWTILFWLVRGTDIALDDHEASFIVVHLVLMTVSIAAAVWAWSTLRVAAAR